MGLGMAPVYGATISQNQMENVQVRFSEKHGHFFSTQRLIVDKHTTYQTHNSDYSYIHMLWGFRSVPTCRFTPTPGSILA